MVKKVTINDVFKRKNENTLKMILLVYIIAYVGATYNHVNDIIEYGFLGYQTVNENVS